MTEHKLIVGLGGGRQDVAATALADCACAHELEELPIREAVCLLCGEVFQSAVKHFQANHDHPSMASPPARAEDRSA